MWWGSCRIRSAATRSCWAVRTVPASSFLWRLAMRRSTLAICALLMVATSGCDQIDTAKAELQRTRAQHPRPPAAPPGQAFSRDVPYVSNDTGTVNPGMSEREVYEVWAAPLAVRRVGQYTYLFFRNSCEYTCGTMDVVTLKDGKVVDAIVRWDGHRYSGESSSPEGRVPVANPGDSLHITPPPPSP